MSKMLDRLLDENWLYDHNWEYYNKDEKLVRDVIDQIRYENTREKIKETSPEEMLSIEMEVLKDILRHQLTQIYQSSEYRSLKELGITKDLGQMGINELFENRSRIVLWLHERHWHRKALLDPKGSKVRRAEVYDCPREVLES